MLCRMRDPYCKVNAFSPRNQILRLAAPSSLAAYRDVLMQFCVDMQCAIVLMARVLGNDLRAISCARLGAAETLPQMTSCLTAPAANRSVDDCD